ncbi:MAG TPA: asparagine synthase (glutamine-hydrolyzing), partial [Vicinamibacterales bacterium]|nr:asparagine synthase (glutamine-hydrolyzing) [Vicinamibacterales bacterium]
GDGETLARMSHALRHRGPDAHGDWSDPEHGVYLAVERLAILDREHAAQPMCSGDRALVVAFNGEIYNHTTLRRELEATGSRFVTSHSDTEVLLHAYRQWGTDLTSHLDGMWALAIYDRAQRSIFLSRDRFGQKPLYYTINRGVFAFASELTGLSQHPAVDRSFSSLSIRKYFAYGFIPAPHAIYEHVFKLPAGCNLSVDAQTLATRLTRYWDFSLEAADTHHDRNEAELAEELRGLLQAAVRRQLQSDVPIGVFLSGGIDSSAIAYYAARETTLPLETFSIGFDAEGYDESAQADRVAALIGTHHHAITLSSAKARCLLSRMASRMDEPIGDSSIICTHLLCADARPSITVALGGEGADELFGGYDPFRALKLARMYSRLVPKPVHRAIRLVAARLPSCDRYMSFDYRVSRALRGLSYAPSLWNPVWIGPLEPSEIAESFEDGSDVESIYSEAIELWDSSAGADLVDRTTMFYVKLYFQDDILAKVDRAGMLNAVEVRSPYLDRDLVEFVQRLPSRFKLRHGRTKYLFKQAMRPLLPEWIVDRPKHGFAVPMAQWLRDGWLAPAADGFPGGPSSKFTTRKLEAHRRGTENNALFLWSLWLLQQIANARVDP